MEWLYQVSDLMMMMMMMISFIFPAFNCTSTSTINAILQAARDINSPVIIQFSNGGAAFLAGKGIKNTGEKAAILGAIAGAQHTRLMAKHYGVPVILHSDHCAKVCPQYFSPRSDPLFTTETVALV